MRYVYPSYNLEALKGIDFAIKEGEFVAILGQNGSGKTTLAKQFNGLFKPTSGRMLVQGRPTTEYGHRELAHLVGYVFQNPDHQIFARTVREEIAFTLQVRKSRDRVPDASPALRNGGGAFGAAAEDVHATDPALAQPLKHDASDLAGADHDDTGPDE